MKKLTQQEISSLLYHDIFDYPLTTKELKKWSLRSPKTHSKIGYSSDKSYYFLQGKNQLVNQRLKNELASKNKNQIALSASKLIGKIPTIKLIAVSGSLAMNNAAADSDIDLLLITSADALWVSRPLVYLLLKFNGYKIRKPKEKNEKDKLCLNLWMDEKELTIYEQNAYTAHELAQLKPLISKNNTYEKLLVANKWVLDYWPNSVEIRNSNFEILNKFKYLNVISNLLLYCLQRLYMSGKLTREQVSLHRAFFHPKDWHKEVEKKLHVK